MTKAKRYKRYSSEFKREAILRAGEEAGQNRRGCHQPQLIRLSRRRNRAVGRQSGKCRKMGLCTRIPVGAGVSGQNILRSGSRPR